MYDLVYIILGFYILYFIVFWYFKVETGARTCSQVERNFGHKKQF
jgi:hypothetical protein